MTMKLQMKYIPELYMLSKLALIINIPNHGLYKLHYVADN